MQFTEEEIYNLSIIKKERALLEQRYCELVQPLGNNLRLEDEGDWRELLGVSERLEELMSIRQSIIDWARARKNGSV